MLILGIALVVMANLGSIQDAWFISLLFGAGMGSVLVLRWVWERITLWSELAAMATSLVLAPVLLVTTEAEWTRLALMAVASTTAAVAAALAGPRTDPAVLRAFWNRVRPPGFWAASAPPGSHPVRRLALTCGITVAAAASLFLALLGLGGLVVRPPEQGPLAHLGALAAAIALVPLWWRRLRTRPPVDEAPRTP